MGGSNTSSASGHTESNKLPEGLSHRIICKHCGRKKEDHRSKVYFGATCVFKDCARCGLTESFHGQYHSPMGYFCTVTLQQGARIGQREAYESDVQSWRKS
eukprot:scaffold278921_cov35-Attheya_sp.AAC.1